MPDHAPSEYKPAGFSDLVPYFVVDGASSRFNLHFYVRDIDAVYKKALECGATSKREPEDMPYGERGSGIVDKWGNI